MKRIARSVILLLLLFASLPLEAGAETLLIPGGEVIGLQLRDETLTVAAFDDALGSCARDAGMKIGDEILKIGGTAVESVEDVRAALADCGGDTEVTVRRDGKTAALRITPRQTEDGPRLGVYLRQGIAGIGTVTFYDPQTRLFGTLGHGVNNARGQLLTMKEGTACPAWVRSVRRGKRGEPGQLKGEAVGESILGPLLKNTPQGVFGIADTPFPGQPMPTAEYSDIRTGSAVIRSTICEDKVQEYSVEILKIYPEDRSDGRNFLLKVTAPDLLAATGGIVQGMSGSTIIQNGKIVGAVTHVLVNSPDTGYGIFIENMLDAAS